MKVRASLWLAVACLGIGFALGFAWSHQERVKVNGEEKLPVASIHAEEGSSGRRRSANLEGSRTAEEQGIKTPPLVRLRAAIGANGRIDVLECLFAIEELGLQECAGAADLLTQSPTRETWALMGAVARRWVELDASDAFREALRHHQRDFQRALGGEAARALVAQDLETALARVTSMQAGIHRNHAVEWVFEAAAEVDPKRAAEVISSEKGFLRNQGLLSRVAAEYARQNPEEALSWAESLPIERSRDQAKRQVLHSWADKNPDVVAMKLAEGAVQDDDLYGRVARSWGKADPAAAIAWVDDISKDGKRLGALDGIEIDLAEVGIERARELIEGVKSEALRERLTAQVAAGLAQQDVQQALAFANDLPDASSRKLALAPIVDEWTRQDAGEAARYLAGLPGNTVSAGLLQNAIATWSYHEPEAASLFVEQMPAGKERDAAAAHMARMLSEENPAKGLEFLNSIGDPKIAGEATRDMIGALVRTDRDMALKLARDLPEEAQPQAYYGLIRGWAIEEAHHAGEWINTLQAGAGKDHAIRAYVSVIDGVDAGAATEWAAAINDPKMRTEATMEAFQRWVRNDRERAAAWLAGAEIAEGLRPFFEHELNDAGGVAFE